ncbi:uncharacterized protein K441DRAFT_536660, partial [Cenococcum geophilum 1.58]|uniref:uncharacterized protein n=1 Tax=Cenococcum geophilum 1.58 TaxID=794803 RepID=UPI00358F65DE
INLYFPFLIIEVKGLAIRLNIVRAQNQATVNITYTFNILYNLKLTIIAYIPYISID